MKKKYYIYKNIINCEDIVQVCDIVIKDKHDTDIEIYKMIFIKMSTKVDKRQNMLLLSAIPCQQ